MSTKLRQFLSFCVYLLKRNLPTYLRSVGASIEVELKHYKITGIGVGRTVGDLRQQFLENNLEWLIIVSSSCVLGVLPH